MAELKLKSVTRTQGNNQALKDGTVRPRTCAFDFQEVDPLIDAFRRMVRGLEFDITESVDLSKITWVLSGDEHVAEYRAPANVVPIEKGKKMGDMLASGELAAAIGVEVAHPDVKPLIPNALEAGLAALRSRGHYPINHTVVVKDDLLAAHGGLAPDVFNAFAEAKRVYVQRLKAGQIEKPTPVDEVHRRVMDITGDPLPYGIAPNRRVLEELIQHSLTQGIITRPVTVEELFPRNTHSLTA